MRSFEKDFIEIKNLFQTVESVYQENKTLTQNEDIYSKKSVSSSKNTPKINSKVKSNDNVI